MDGDRVQRTVVTRDREVEPVEPVTAMDANTTAVVDPHDENRDTAKKLVQAVQLVFGLVMGLIAIRFILLALGANPEAGFADFILGVTDPLVSPFQGLFSDSVSGDNVIEYASIVAFLVYGLVGWLLSRLMWLAFGTHRSSAVARSTRVHHDVR